MSKIRVAIVGVGNCASSLVQGISYYKSVNDKSLGLMHWDLGGYEATDVEFVAAYDIDERKVGTDLSQAIFAPPNCTMVFCDKVPASGVTVQMGAVLDGMAEHMPDMPAERSFVKSSAQEATKAEVVAALKAVKADVLVNFLPVGSQEATEFYMECALEAGVGVVNCMPVFIASTPEWAKKFRDAGVPIVGDDIKAQLGATIVHRALSNLFRQRGVRVDRTYQLNTGGNTDFLNMMDRTRLNSKKLSKTEAVQSVLAERLKDENIHVGPSDYVPWLNDNKLCFLRMEGTEFGGVPMNIEVRLSVEDSPNSAGVVIDAIRCCKLGLDRGQGGVLVGPSAFFCKHPPYQYTDDEAERMVETFIYGESATAEAKCLILAAGQGTRLRQIAPSKPLAEIHGIPMIERVMQAASEGGMHDFAIVTGYEGDRLEGFLQAISSQRGLRVATRRNEDWKGSNGLSVLAAQELVGERFVLLMCDHLFDPSILRELLRRPMGKDELVLAVDRRLDNPLVDRDDVTRVDVAGDGKIRRIGKGIEGYNAYDTGVFLATPALFDAIREDIAAGGPGSLSAGVQRLADRGRAKAYDIGDRFWIDVDDEVAFTAAEREQSRAMMGG
ncbi:MAG: NTP transferase domain-containing protein [Caulobacteraceae bacterium]